MNVSASIVVSQTTSSRRSIEFVGPNVDRESSARHILEGNHALPSMMRPFYSTSTRSSSATLTDEHKNFWGNRFASG